VSPTSPTFVTLNDRLNKAHHRIRELESGEAELLAQIRILCAVITDLTHEVHARSAVELTSSPVQTSTPDDGSGSRFGIGDHVDKSDMTQSACPPVAHAQANASRPAPASTSRIGAKRAKTRRSHVV
jgi:hypothetical protein